MLEGRGLLQYAIGTLDGEVIIEVVEISYCDGAYQSNNKKDISQLYSTAVEFSHSRRHPSTRKKQRLSKKYQEQKEK